MKFVDLINEDFTPDSEQLKELKNAKAVFLAHRKGTLNYRTMGLMKTNHELNKTDVIVDRTDTVVGYKLGEPEYNWYSDSGFAKDMYLSVSVKNITVYIKDPVLYLTVTNSPDRIRDYYGNLIHNNVVPRVTKRFKEYGVKLHITPKVDFVLVEPKKTEEINEEHTPEELKKIKNIKAVFLAHKKDIVSVRFNSPKTRITRDVLIGYKLGEPIINFDHPNKINKVFVNDITLYIKDPEVYENIIDSPAYTRYVIRGSVYPKVVRKLSKHQVYFFADEVTTKYVFVEPKKTEDPEQINEDPTVGEQNQLTDKEMKNFKALWKSYKEGVFKYDDKKYMYQLKNEHDVFKMPSTEYASSRIVVLINGAFESSIRVYEIQDNGHNVLLDYGLENRLYSLVKAKVKRNFASHNVHLHL